MKTKENPIAVRSKEWLCSSLLELMKEKSFKEISISELTAKADLSRRTFYRLFSSKEDILLYYIDKIWQKGARKLYDMQNNNYFYTSYWYLSFWYEHRELAILLYKNDLVGVIQKFLNKISIEIYNNLKDDSPKYKNKDALSYAISYSSGGSLNVLWKWAEEGMIKTPEEIMELLMEPYKYKKSEYNIKL